MKNNEIVERFANRLENAIDHEDMANVAGDVDLLQNLVRGIIVVEGVVKELRAAANTQEGEKA